MELSAPVLIIEEKPICREALWRVLQSCGLPGRPHFAATAQAAASGELSNLRLVVVDLFSIDFDFDSLAGLVERVKPSPVVALDDRANPSARDLALRAGAAAYGGKDQPVDAIRALFCDAITARG